MSELPLKPQINEYAGGDRPKFSLLALSSAVLGILACLPALLWPLSIFADPHDWGYLLLVTVPIMLAPISLAVAVMALLTSLVGFRATRNAQTSGRNLATVGLVLGIVTTLAWGGIFSIRAYASAVRYIQARAPSAAAVQFLNDLSKSPTAASTDCDSAVAAGDLSYAATRIQQWGGLGKLTIGHFSMDSNPTSTAPSCVLDVSLGAPSSSHHFAIRMKKLAGGWKVYWYRFN
jgi:hypothetical protein